MFLWYIHPLKYKAQLRSISNHLMWHSVISNIWIYIIYQSNLNTINNSGAHFEISRRYIK